MSTTKQVQQQRTYTFEDEYGEHTVELEHATHDANRALIEMWDDGAQFPRIFGWIHGHHQFEARDIMELTDVLDAAEQGLVFVCETGDSRHVFDDKSLPFGTNDISIVLTATERYLDVLPEVSEK